MRFPAVTRPISISRAKLSVAIVMLLSGMASAQLLAEPKYLYPKYEEITALEWKAAVKAGLILTTGNAQTTSFTFGLSLSRKEAGNKISIDAGVAYARSSVLAARDGNMNTIIEPGEIIRTNQTTSNAWFTKLRYDRFFTAHNAGYVAALVAADKPAGKDFYGGGQLGYSRTLYKSDRNEAMAEIGYDLSYESYITPIDTSVTIHSMRVFLGESFKLSDATNLFANLESLFNLNSESVPDYDNPTVNNVAPFKDARVVAKTGLLTTLWKNFNFSFGVTLKYDHNPAVRPAFVGTTYAPGFIPFADKLDTITEAALVVNFI